MRHYLTAASVIALSFAGQAFAQTTDAAGASADADSNEIVVTAQRRAEKLEDVPITMTVVNGSQLTEAGVTAVNKLGELVPAFRLDLNGAFAQPAIRGVSTALANVGGGSAVGVYVDGFYNASPLTTDFEFLNVNSIQVLKGPQGTLFGRNTTAGAVLVTTSEPTLDTRAQFQADYGRFNALKVGGYVTTGLGSAVAVDVAGQISKGDGFMTNLTTNNDKVGKYNNKALRMGVKLFLGNDNSILFRYNHTDRVDPTQVLWSVYQDPDGRYQTASFAFGLGAYGVKWGKNNRTMASDPGFNPFFGSTTNAYQLTGKFDLGFADLTSYSQYRREWSKHDIEVDDSSQKIFRVSFNNRDTLRSQEFLLNSKPGGPLTWVLGAFYMHQTAGQTDFTIEEYGGFGNFGKQYATHIDVESYAVFLDGTYAVSDKLFLTAGGRYSHEKNDAFWDCTPTGVALGVCPPSNKLKGSWNNFSPRAVVRYQITEDSNVYASYTKGFKSGLMNVNGFQSQPIEPEKINSFEVGYKMASGGTRLDLSSFYYDYKNLQVSTYQGTKSITTNAAASKVYGLEASISQQLTNEFSVTAGAAYTHGRYKNYTTAPKNVFDYVAGTALNDPSVATNNHMIRSPDFTGNISLNYKTPAFGGNIALNSNLYFTSKVYFDAANRNEQKGYEVLSARATWSDSSDRFSVSLWGNNLTDKAYKTQVLPNGVGTGVSWAAPLTYGVSAGVKY